MSIDEHAEARIGSYLVGDEIGRGGMGVVYRATHVHLDREVALKLLAPELSGNDEFRQRFLRESRIAASVDHPNIITVYDAGDANGTLYIAMRYVQGLNLAQLLRRDGPLKPATALELLDHVAAALDAAHQHGLIHRDVKPANILIAPEGCYLTDFGLTKQAGATTTSPSLTKTGAFLGTVHYVAPEQIEGKEIGPQVDVYALGCVLFECLTGAPPYTKESEVAVIFAHLNDPPPRPTALRPELPATIDEVVAKALSKAPEDRYRSCGELLAAARTALTPARPTEEPHADAMRIAPRKPTRRSEEAGADAMRIAPRTPTRRTEEAGTDATRLAPLRDPGLAVDPTRPAPQPTRAGRRLRRPAVIGALLLAAVGAIGLAVALSQGSGTKSTLRQDVVRLNSIVQLFITGKHLSHDEHRYTAAAQNRQQVLNELDGFHAPARLHPAAETLREMTSYSLQFNQLMAQGKTAQARAPDEAHNGLRSQFVTQFNSYAQRYLGITYSADQF